ncbi:unnamed protein product [Knipowitschia caucasica]
MRINENVLLAGNRVVLVPYTRAHVPRYHVCVFRYHVWMQSPELQTLTASEPLSLQQEYDMQTSWSQDEDKLTFILLSSELWSDPSVPEEQCMMGDANLFVTDPTDTSKAELEVMIAEPQFRGRGIGTEVVFILMSYAVSKLGIMRFQVKIGLGNLISINMFKKLRFTEVSTCRVFNEVTMELEVDPSVRTWILDQTSKVQERDYGSERAARTKTEAGLKQD